MSTKVLLLYCVSEEMNSILVINFCILKVFNYIKIIEEDYI